MNTLLLFKVLLGVKCQNRNQPSYQLKKKLFIGNHLLGISVGTLRSEDSDGSENVAEKVNSRSFNLHHDYSKSLTLSNAGEPSKKLKSYEPYPLSSEREEKLRRRLRSSSVKREKRHFHVVVVQTRQGNVQKGVMHAQKLLFWLFNLLLFWRSRCRRRRRRLWWRRQRERLKYNWFRSRLHGSGKMFQWTIFFPCKPFTRNRANSATDCSTVCRSKLMARSRRSRVNVRQIRTSFCPFKNLSRPV